MSDETDVTEEQVYSVKMGIIPPYEDSAYSVSIGTGYPMAVSFEFYKDDDDPETIFCRILAGGFPWEDPEVAHEGVVSILTDIIAVLNQDATDE